MIYTSYQEQIPQFNRNDLHIISEIKTHNLPGEKWITQYIRNKSHNLTEMFHTYQE